MNYRSKTTAMLLCLFLWWMGAHWFYLGRTNWGILYAAVMVGGLPLAFVVVPCLASIAPGLGAMALVLGWMVQGIVILASLYDFFHLLSIPPARFDYEYNQ